MICKNWLKVNYILNNIINFFVNYQFKLFLTRVLLFYTHLP